MALTGEKFFHVAETGVAMKGETVNNADATSKETILEPWAKGRQVAFIALVGNAGIAAGSILTAKVQGQKRSDDSWVTLKDGGGSNDLEFTAADLTDGGALETGGSLLGTLDLGRVDSDTYKAIRLLVNNAAATAANLSVGYVIFDLVRPASDDDGDQLFYKQRYGTAGPS